MIDRHRYIPNLSKSFEILKSAVSVLDPPTGKAQKFIGTIPWQSSESYKDYPVVVLKKL